MEHVAAELCREVADLGGELTAGLGPDGRFRLRGVRA